MKRGRPKKSQTKPAKRARPDSARPDAAASANGADPDAAAVLGAPPAAGKRGRPRGQGKRRSLIDLLLDDQRLTDDDRAAIRYHHDEGLTVNDVAALVTFELRLAMRLHATPTAGDGALSDIGLMVAVGKASSRAAAAAQLKSTAGAATDLPARMEVVFVQEGLPTAQGLPGREHVAPAARGPTGHRLDVEQ